MKTGIHQMTLDAYLADPCPAPSLSSGIAQTLLTASPRHAWYEHPQLSPDLVREQEEKFDLGTAAHAYILQGESSCSIIEAPDWRSQSARAARDAARVNGKIPILAHRWNDVLGMANAAKIQLKNFEETPKPFTAGKPEQTLIWQEGEVWCRARCDWLHDDHRTIDELKTTGASAHPEIWSRALFGAGHDIRAAFYLRGLRAITAREGTFRFVAMENYQPYMLSVIGLAPDALALADRKVSQAIALWAECLKRGEFPGYPTRTCYAELPPWQEAQWMEHELRQAGIRDDGRPIGDLLA